jgi:chromosome segregation ATPase
VDDS